MELAGGCTVLYVYRGAEDAATVRGSDVCRIRLSDRSWSPASANGEEVDVDLALGSAHAPESVPTGVVRALPGTRIGDRLRLSLSPTEAKNAAGGPCVPFNLQALEALGKDAQEVTVEVLSATGVRSLCDGVKLLRRYPECAAARLPNRFSEVVVRYHLLSFSSDSRGGAEDNTSVSVALDSTCASDVYDHWLAERTSSNCRELDSAKRLAFISDLDDPNVPIGVEEALPFVINHGACEVMLTPPDGGPRSLLLLLVLSAEPALAELQLQDRVDAASRRKDLGTAQLKAGKDELARSLYQSAVDCAGETDLWKDAPADLVASADQVRLSCLLNVSLTCVRLCEWQKVIAATTQALDIKDGNAKALYRRGVANARLKDYTAAVRDLSAAAELEPSDGNIARELNLAMKKADPSSRPARTAVDKALSGALLASGGVFSDGRENASHETPKAAEPFDAEKVRQDKLKLKEMLSICREQVTEKLADADGEEEAANDSTGKPPLNVMQAFREQLAEEVAKGDWQEAEAEEAALADTRTAQG
eukprot:TRINITY_DN11786_c0_g4_i1.p1 TRINITY_DN11786_c0_g4~~TRINITY_DN11786_c0_g4_i1.p1  ORF type:complete len:550 (-),score=99.64 TRINITY_DN11786_c0_g4_i1:119-1726(-)